MLFKAREHDQKLRKTLPLNSFLLLHNQYTQCVQKMGQNSYVLSSLRDQPSIPWGPSGSPCSPVLLCKVLALTPSVLFSASPKQYFPPGCQWEGRRVFRRGHSLSYANSYKKRRPRSYSYWPPVTVKLKRSIPLTQSVSFLHLTFHFYYIVTRIRVPERDWVWPESGCQKENRCFTNMTINSHIGETLL